MLGSFGRGPTENDPPVHAWRGTHCTGEGRSWITGEPLETTLASAILEGGSIVARL